MPLPIIAAVFGGSAGALMEKYGIGLNYRDIASMVTGSGTGSGVEAQAYALAKQRLISAEGRKAVAYIDTTGNLTVGIGHKVVTSDRIKLGQTISESQIDRFFGDDITKAFNSAISQAKQIEKYNTEMIAALACVNFQLGTYWTVEFKNTWSLLKKGDSQSISRAISNLTYSQWAKQTPKRVTAFISSIKTVYGVA